MERQIRKEYRKNSDLREAEKIFLRYMEKVKGKTQAEYDAYINADDGEKKDLKKKYIQAVKSLTVYSKEYKKMIERVTRLLAKANQNALDIVNNEMVSIYTDNYNQVAEDCRRVGIKVNGRKK